MPSSVLLGIFVALNILTMDDSSSTPSSSVSLPAGVSSAGGEEEIAPVPAAVALVGRSISVPTNIKYRTVEELLRATDSLDKIEVCQVGDEMDPNTNAPLMIASSFSGLLPSSRLVTVDFLRKLCTLFKAGKARGKSKHDLRLLLANRKIMRGAVSAMLQEDESDQTVEEIKENSKVRLLTIAFSEQHMDDVLSMNDKKKRTELDAGNCGYNKKLFLDLSESYHDTLLQAVVLFEEDHHVQQAVELGLDPENFKATGWAGLVAYWKEIAKSYNEAMSKFNKSGTHDQNLYERGFCQSKTSNHNRISTYYFHLLLQQNPGADKNFLTDLASGIFSESGGKKATARDDGSASTPSTSSTSTKKRKAAVGSQVAATVVIMNGLKAIAHSKDTRAELATLNREIPDLMIKIQITEHVMAREFMEKDLESKLERKEELEESVAKINASMLSEEW
jgi:hypothetical protein